MTRLIEVEEVIAKGDELLAEAYRLAAAGYERPSAGLRSWYDRTLAERAEKRNHISTPAGELIVDHVYDITITRPVSQDPVDRATARRRWRVVGRGGWADGYVVIRKTNREHPQWGTNREIRREEIVDIWEVTA